MKKVISPSKVDELRNKTHKKKKDTTLRDINYINKVISLVLPTIEPSISKLTNKKVYKFSISLPMKKHYPSDGGLGINWNNNLGYEFKKHLIDSGWVHGHIGYTGGETFCVELYEE